MRPFVWLLTIIPGFAAVGVSAYYLFLDWASLNRSFARWEYAVYHNGTPHQIAIAETYQNAFRINCFADGLGVLLGAILVAIGLNALCVLQTKQKEI